MLRNRSARNVPTRSDGGVLDHPSPITAPSLRPAGPRQQQQQDVGRKQADHTDALWAEMQSTLEEVELSAVSGTHVFGAEHSKALDELRTAQIALAQAWARSEADEAMEMDAKDAPVVKGAAMLGIDMASGGTAATPAAGSDGAGTGAGAGGAGTRKERRGSKLEAETENDILLARKRREANDRYFERVNGGVLDVVSKLEDVAVAMRGVEQESRDIWSESEDNTTSASASVATGN